MRHAAAAHVPPTVAPHSAPSARSRRRDETARLVLMLAEASDEEGRTALQDELIEVNLTVASDVAKRYHDRGIASGDLDQVANLGLVKAARGFDPGRGHDFLSFAVPTIRGEVRKHFRDAGWTIRPPRRIQELQPQITRAEADLFQSLGRSPRPSELAAHLGVDVEDVHEALAANGCFAPTSLDTPADGMETSPLDLIGEDDDGFHGAEARAMLRQLLVGVTERERIVLELRFCQGLTQREIGDEIGVTQMQVSRILSQLLERLRKTLGQDPAA